MHRCTVMPVLDSAKHCSVQFSVEYKKQLFGAANGARLWLFGSYTRCGSYQAGKLHQVQCEHDVKWAHNDSWLCMQFLLTPGGPIPGECLPLNGSSGWVEVRLREPIEPLALSYEHLPTSIAYDSRSAPLSVSVVRPRISGEPATCCCACMGSVQQHCCDDYVPELDLSFGGCEGAALRGWPPGRGFSANPLGCSAPGPAYLCTPGVFKGLACMMTASGIPVWTCRTGAWRRRSVLRPTAARPCWATWSAGRASGRSRWASLCTTHRRARSTPSRSMAAWLPITSASRCGALHLATPVHVNLLCETCMCWRAWRLLLSPSVGREVDKTVLCLFAGQLKLRPPCIHMPVSDTRAWAAAR